MTQNSEDDPKLYLFNAIKNGEELTSKHLDLSIRQRFFDYASMILLKGVRLENMDSLIEGILESDLILKQDFYFFAISCCIEGIRINTLSNFIGSMNENNISYVLPLIIYQSMVFGIEQYENDENGIIDYSKLINSINDQNSCVLYEVLYVYLNKSAIRNVLTNSEAFDKAYSTITKPENISRILELSNSLLSKIKSLPKIAKKAFAMDFTIALKHLTQFLIENYVPNNKAITAIDSTCVLFQMSLSNMYSNITKIKNRFSLKDIGNSFDEIKESITKTLKTSLSNNRAFSFSEEYSSSTIAYILAIIDLIKKNGIDSVSKYIRVFESLTSDIETRVSNDFKSVNQLCERISQQKRCLYNPDSEVFKALRYSSDICLFTVYFSSCSLLEARVLLESANYASSTRFFHPSYKDVLNQLVTPASINLLSSSLQENEELYETMLNTISSTFDTIDGLPGFRVDLSFDDFTPPIQWSWPKVPNYEWPSDPATISNILFLQESINNLVVKNSKLKPITKCMHKYNDGNQCNANANNVCPHCKKLVLCNMHIKTDKCPLCNAQIIRLN